MSSNMRETEYNAKKDAAWLVVKDGEIGKVLLGATSDECDTDYNIVDRLCKTGPVAQEHTFFIGYNHYISQVLGFLLGRKSSYRVFTRSYGCVLRAKYDGVLKSYTTTDTYVILTVEIHSEISRTECTDDYI